MKELKTNVSIKFTTIEEYREIELTLVSMGYVNDVVHGFYNLGFFLICDYSNLDNNAVYGKTYNSLKDFLA